MKEYVGKNLLLISVIIFGGLLVSLAIYFNYDLDVLQKIFSIIGSLSLVVALYSYLYKKKQDETLAAIEQIAFFREKIIYEWNKVHKSIKEKNPAYWFSRIKIKNDKYNIEDIKNEFSHNFENQLSLFLDFSNGQINNYDIGPILGEQIFLLNMLEEFSLKVKHFKTEQHPALHSVHHLFIELIERNAVAIFFIRDITSNNQSYSATLSLYSLWVSKVEKSNIINNLERYGFITKEKKQEMLKKQRENINKIN